MKRNLTLFPIAIGAAVLVASCGGHDIGESDVGSGLTFATQIGTSSSGPFQINVRDVSGSSPIPKTPSNLNCFEADYWPGKKMYVFLEIDPIFSKQNLYTMIEGSPPVPHTQTNFNHHNPRFSPDGNWIVFSEDQGTGTQIFKVPAGGGVSVETQLTQASGQNSFPSVSTDNQSVVFASTLQGTSNYQIYTVPISGGSVTRIRSDGQSYKYPTYNQADNKILCAMAGPAANSQIVELPTNGQAPTQVTALASATVDAHPRYLANGFVVFDRAVASVNSGNPQVYSTKGGVERNLSLGDSVLFEVLQSDQ